VIYLERRNVGRDFVGNVAGSSLGLRVNTVKY